MMSPWIAKVIILLASIVLVAIRAPHGQRSRKVVVVKSSRGKLEAALLTIAWGAFFLPLVWVVSPALAFADYPLRPIPLVAGTLCLAVGLWLFHRSHVDLGTNWSITLEVRDGHRLITQGLYRHVRHPMYLALLIYSLGQLLTVPNYVAGPSNVVALVLLVAFRLGPEERLMLQEFGAEYEEYRARSRRLLPGIW